MLQSRTNDVEPLEQVKDAGNIVGAHGEARFTLPLVEKGANRGGQDLTRKEQNRGEARGGGGRNTIDTT